MDFNATVDLIIKELHEAHDIIDDLRNYRCSGNPGRNGKIEMQKCCRNNCSLKNVQNGTAIKPATATAAQKTENETKAKTEPKTEPGFRLNLATRDRDTGDTPPEKPAIAKKEIVAESPVITVKNEEPHVTKKKSDARTIIADTFSDRPGCLNEQLTSSRKTRIFPRSKR